MHTIIGTRLAHANPILATKTWSAPSFAFLLCRCALEEQYRYHISSQFARSGCLSPLRVISPHIKSQCQRLGLHRTLIYRRSEAILPCRPCVYMRQSGMTSHLRRNQAMQSTALLVFLDVRRLPFLQPFFYSCIFLSCLDALLARKQNRRRTKAGNEYDTAP